MYLKQRLENFARIFEFDIVNEDLIANVLQKQEMIYGITLCPCTFIQPTTPLNHILECRCPCPKLYELNSGETCKCGLFKKR